MEHICFARARAGATTWVAVSLIMLIFACLLAIPIVQARRKIKRFAAEIKQRAQLAATSTALELFSNDFAGYPPSDANDPTGVPYGGAMKLAEAIMGQNLFGFHPKSVFRVDGLSHDGGKPLYPVEPNESDLKGRRGPYLLPENANAYRLVDVYGKGHTGPFDENLFVLCDTYIRKRASGVKTGMPILYYRTNIEGTVHDVNNPENLENIYDYRDNHVLVDLGLPGKPNAVHPLSDPRRFYMNTQSDKIVTRSTPYNADSFVLISAGEDGLYGTADDICNFDWKYCE